MKEETTLLITVVLVLTLVGILMVYSASAVGGNDRGLLIRQLFYVGVGVVLMFGAARFDYHRFTDKFVFRVMLLTGIGMLLLVLVPGIGIEVDGARRWLGISGITRFQPSEVAKFVLILWLAAKLSQNREHGREFFRGFFPPVAVTCLFAGLVLAERDLGIPAMMLGVAGIMMFVAGIRWHYLALSIAPAAALAVGLVAFFPHRVRRIFAFVNPWDYRDDAGWQLIQGYSAFARGGVLGSGAGAGEQKLFYLPAAHTDFIFPVVGEELGLAGTLTVVALFGVFAWAAYRIAKHAPDNFGGLLASGIACMISLQAAFIMAVTTGLLPTKGLPLPFISYGGTALAVFLGMVGVLINISIQASVPESHRVRAHGNSLTAAVRGIS
ncbi:MAG TPA: putative lipid II flippase FtsW [Candidatus Hydrogenedentes bacterium]|nr:putative lipid II flippase FtsW [Candidatus Hydrogenedentota bacterium]